MSALAEVGFLKLMLHGASVGYLAGFQGGRNVLTFDESFRSDPSRPTFSLITHPNFPNAQRLLGNSWASRQKLHPTLSNLLPEGALRELLAQGLKTHPDSEFKLFSYLGRDLPGALVASPMDPEEVPRNLLAQHGGAKPVTLETVNTENQFSLAGVQVKFSMKEKDGRYHITRGADLGDWIIKTPSTMHKQVPLNEYTAMTLAALAGANVPEIRLVELNKLDRLPQISLPDEKYAFAIRRFDRADGQRIHMEDFAQIFAKYPHEKYGSANYEQIGRVVYEYTGDALANAQQYARRLLINILLANGDAHLKNWTLLYPDQVTPELSPAYDIVTTSVYINGEREYALNLGRTKEWYKVEMAHFESWANKAGIPWRAIKPHLDDVMDKARELWPRRLEDLPMDEGHKGALRAHWNALRSDFRITMR